MRCSGEKEKKEKEREQLKEDREKK